MIQFALAISIRIEDPVVQGIELVNVRVVVDTGDNPNALDDVMGIAGVLTPDHFNVEGKILIDDRIVEQHKTVR